MTMTARSAPLLLLLLTGSCSAVRPVKLGHAAAPASFVGNSDGKQAAPGAETVSTKPNGAPRATNEPVWWTAFADPALDNAIQEGLRNNYFLRDVRTLIYENNLDPAIPWNYLWPLQIGIPAGTPAGIQRVRISVPNTNKAATLSEYESINAGITASYQVDLFGNLDARRRVGKEVVEQQRQSTEQASQNLAEQIAGLWFDILVERALKELTEREVQYNQELYDLINARFNSHLTSRLAVLQQEQQLLNIKSQVPLVVARIAILNSQLTGLLGRTPHPVDDLVPVDRKLPDLPPPPNLGTPDDLNENTPEMRFAKLRVTEIEYRKNQNLSSWLPVIELVGSTGFASYIDYNTLQESFLGVRLTWPLFDGGRRIMEAKQLELTLKRRKWQYDLAIKTAVGRVQDALLNEKSQGESLQSLRGQVELGKKLLEEARRLFEQGQSDYLPVLTALSNLSALERDALRAQRLLLNYRVQLYRALGGNWSYDVTKLEAP